MKKSKSLRLIRAVRKGQRRNLEPKPPRKKNWAEDIQANGDELDYQEHERIMPIDEADRRLAIEQAASAPAPHVDASESPALAVQSETSTVVSVSAGACTVVRDGSILRCSIKSALTAAESQFTNAVAVGDEVLVADDGAGGGIVEQVLPRRTTLARPDVHRGNRSRRQQIIAANVDQLLIVASWRDPMFWLELIDRCIIAAERSGLLPVVCVNKTDLVEDAVELSEAIGPYEALGHRTVKTSAVTGAGVSQLRALLRDKTTALTGLSGGGKSSLISAVQPGLDLRTASVSDSRKQRGQGQHTTTQAEMFELDIGGFVVDTPGIREFGLIGLRRRELADFFPEINALAPKCRFTNCTHLEEPGCAVLAGRPSGAVPESRYHSYLTIISTLPE